MIYTEQESFIHDSNELAHERSIIIHYSAPSIFQKTLKVQEGPQVP
jgi:hypothetical protein